MQNIRYGAAAALLLCLMMTGCGQRGDLYFPKDQPVASQPPQQK